MPRRVRSARIETRSSRARLAPRRNPYWVRLGEGLHLGYVPQRAGGKWVMRTYLGKDVTWQYRGKTSARRYRKEIIGQTDDFSGPDNLTFLSFDQAQAKARKLASERAHAEAGLSMGPLSVSQATTDYIDYLRS
jgi:hypothetical protein